MKHSSLEAPNSPNTVEPTGCSFLSLQFLRVDTPVDVTMPGRTNLSRMEAPDPPEAVEPLAASAHYSRPGPAFRVGDGVFQAAPLGKYLCNIDSPVPDIFFDHSVFDEQPVIHCDHLETSQIVAVPVLPACRGSVTPSSSQHVDTPIAVATSRQANAGAWMYYQNVRGVRTKIDELFLAAADSNHDVILLTETGLNDCISSVQLFGVEYEVYRCDRSIINSNKTSFGGVLIAVAKCFPSSLVSTINGNQLEQVCVKTTIRGKRLFLCATYIPPDKSRDAAIFEAHIATIHELCNSCSHDDIVLVCGDFNQPHIIWEVQDDELIVNSDSVLSPASIVLLDGMQFLNMKQNNLQRNYRNRLLDLVFCSMDYQISTNVSVAPLLPVDPHHPPLVLSLQYDSDWYDTVHDDMESNKLNFRRLDFVALIEYISSIDWLTVLGSGDVDEMAEIFCNVLRRWFESNVPSSRRAFSPAWSTSHLRSLKRERNKCQRNLRLHRTACSKQAFQQASKAYRRLNASLYKAHTCRIQTNLRRNPKSFWNFVNSKRKSPAIPENLFLGETASTTPVDCCNLFAKHFSSVFSCNSATDSEADAAASSVPENLINLSTFEVSQQLITEATKKLKTSLTPGPDGVPAVVYTRCASFLAEPLAYIFNKSFEQRKFPNIWKQSLLFPVFKKGDRSDVANYRGITNLSAASKLFEIIVSDACRFSAKMYVSPDQHGFWPGRSVTTNLLEFTSTCMKHMEAKAQVDVIYTDLKAAFDRIDHAILIRKLSRLGVSNYLTDWLSSYLSGRTLRVQHGNCMSEPFTNKSGVPQGSNLGPLLFLLYFNDAALMLGAGCKLVYADDLKLYLVVRSIEDCRRLQELLDKFARWCRLNFITMSISKCIVMTFHRKRLPFLFDYNIDGVDLERVDRVNDLGVLLDSKMSFNLQRENVINKANRQLGFVCKISKEFTDPYCLKALYCSLVRPILEYASPIWAPHQLTWILRLERVQKRFIRTALRNLPWRDPQNLPPYPDRCRLLDLETLDRRRKISQATHMVKLLNGEFDASGLLAMVNFSAPQRSLRDSTLLQPPFHRTSFGYHEPLTTIIRCFSLLEELFEFDENSRVFTLKVRRSNLL